MTDTAKTWRCFHCDEFFTDKENAREHFGSSLMHEPACQIDIVKFREMESYVERAREEDTDTDRAMHRLRNEHATALRREEEKGYARGLRDAAKFPADVSPEHTPTPPLDCEARIVDGCLTIRVPIDTLAFAAQNSDYFFDAAENGEALVITDQSNFAKSVAHALNVEGEDGSTPVTRMLDKAFVWVVEQGEEGFELAAKGSKP